ncbi:extracellular solute-binding protein [Cohnella silvisoli]|uniref:Extracellular solute-binding protein n=1 Tax=Cohnella silvisoli TaxID=2873699 RepID=A0ABV1L3W2_9BACL|nr:extracellular solute-binding protein [Cohnella silvisoli]MCD9025801.1 extracellular solute-binding protein [Cohnella silvisoli]
MAKRKRWAITFLALVLVMSVMAACSGKNETSGGQDTGSKPTETGSTASVEKEESPLKNGKFDPEVTVTTWGCYGKDTKFKDGDTFEKNVATEWMKTNLGINFKYSWTSPWENDACATKMRLALSSGEQLPDVVFVPADDKGRVLIASLIETGNFMDVNEVFDKYASDKYKDILTNHPELWTFAMKDGKHYGIPLTYDPFGNAPLLYIREDWLKKLNLQQPKTIDDLEKVMDAFTNQDPDGNGKKDTYGLALATKYSLLGETFASTGWIFGAYGTVPTYWIKTADGSLQYGSIQPGAKEALSKLRSWYEKGYLDPEFASKDAGKEVELVTSGKAGIINGPYWLPIWPLPDLQKNVPGATMLPTMLPEGPEGKPGFNGSDALLGVYLINKNAEHPEAITVFLNKLLEANLHLKGSNVENGFVEGFDYVMENGKPKVSTEYRIDKLLIGNNAPNVPEKNVETLAYLATGAEPRDGYELNSMQYKAAHIPGSIIQKEIPFEIKNSFTGANTPTMVSKMEALKKMETEVFTKIIYGKAPLDSFDDFVSKWKSSGGDQMTKEVNDWYVSINKK